MITRWMSWKVGNNTKKSLSQGNWPCEIIHFTFQEVSTGADLLTSLDLLDYVREGYLSVLYLLPPDDPPGQQAMRTRSKPHGPDGLSPRATQIVRGINQHAEVTAKFAKQVLLCTVHRGTILITSEDFGGHPATGPLSLWMMTKLQTLEGLDDAHRGAGFSCQLGNAEQGHAIGVFSNLSSISQGAPTVAASSRRSIRSGLSEPRKSMSLCDTAQHQGGYRKWSTPFSSKLQSRRLVLAEVPQRSGCS